MLAPLRGRAHALTQALNPDVGQIILGAQDPDGIN